MSSTSESSSPTTYQRQSNEDYASYVSRITKMRSMSEGTHSPALQDRPGPTQHTFVGRFGTVVYLQRLDQTTTTTPAAQRTTTTASAAPPAAQRTTTTAAAAAAPPPPPAAQRTTTTAPAAAAPPPPAATTMVV